MNQCECFLGLERSRALWARLIINLQGVDGFSLPRNLPACWFVRRPDHCRSHHAQDRSVLASLDNAAVSCFPEKVAVIVRKAMSRGVRTFHTVLFGSLICDLSCKKLCRAQQVLTHHTQSKTMLN